MGAGGERASAGQRRINATALPPQRMMRILHLEDNIRDAELIQETLSDKDLNCHITRVDTRHSFLEAIKEGVWDIILADYSLPSFDGLSALDIVVNKYPGLPFIFVTGALGEELAVETLKSGATDYILKPHLDRLPRALTRALREHDLTIAQRQADLNLRATLREKELLLQEVHHRVKNNLAIICSLLEMQADAFADPILSSALHESQKRIHSMALIHEMLYSSSSMTDVDFAGYTRQLAAEVSTSYGIYPAKIRLQLELEPVRLEIALAIPCGLILNELLSNALKYAFPDRLCGDVNVFLQQRLDRIRLTVEDTGVGLPEAGASSEVKSLGLRIVHILTKQLGGSLSVKSSPGTRFVLEFSRVSNKPSSKP